MMIDENEFNAIEGWLTLPEGKKLAELAEDVGMFSIIVEIGSWKGKSTYCLSRGVGENGIVYAIDHFKGSKEHGDVWTFPQFHVNMERYKCNNVVPIVGKSTEIRWLIKDDFVDLLFIDGSHEYADVANDYAMYSTVVKKGGIICLHDTGPNGWEGPNKLLDKIMAQDSEKVVNMVLVDSLTVLRVVA